MAKAEKIGNLQKYLEDKVQKLGAKEVPARHQAAPQAYKNWLELEIKRTSTKIEELKIQGK